MSNKYIYYFEKLEDTKNIQDGNARECVYALTRLVMQLRNENEKLEKRIEDLVEDIGRQGIALRSLTDE
jgi:hypothetical protein